MKITCGHNLYKNKGGKKQQQGAWKKPCTQDQHLMAWSLAHPNALQQVQIFLNTFLFYLNIVARYCNMTYNSQQEIDFCMKKLPKMTGKAGQNEIWNTLNESNELMGKISLCLMIHNLTKMIIKGNAHPKLEHTIKQRYRSFMHENNNLLNSNYQLLTKYLITDDSLFVVYFLHSSFISQQQDLRNKLLIFICIMNQSHNVRVYDSEAAVIQLVGDMKDNIQELIHSLNCKCGANGHLRAILTIYCDKINKLRAQRDYYKKVYDQIRVQNHSQVYGSQSNHSSEVSTRQSLNRKQDSNILSMLQRELVVPVSLQMRKHSLQNNQDVKQSCLNNENFNPQDSLLISQSSEQIIFPNNKQRIKSRERKQSKKGNQLCIAKSFQQFLQQKVQENHSRQKISEDMIALASKRNRLKTSNRGPLLQKSYLAVN